MTPGKPNGAGNAVRRDAGSPKHAAVSIVAVGGACAAAAQLQGHRILSVQAPRLPLSDCTRPMECQCRFKKYADRRDDEDGRRQGFGSARSIWYSGEERRASRGRREND